MLSPKEITLYRDQGYLLLPGLLDAEWLRRARAWLDGMVTHASTMAVSDKQFGLAMKDGQPIPGRLHKVQSLCVAAPEVLALASAPMITGRVATLLGTDDLDVFGTKFFPKLPAGSTSTHWHQDNYYFGLVTEEIISCAIQVDASDRSNGCLRVIPGSHKQGRILPHKTDPKTPGSQILLDEAGAIDVACPEGTVVLFSANLVHGA